MAATYKTIRVWTSVDRKERLAALALTPGMLIKEASGKVTPHSAAGGTPELFLVAEEDELQGREITTAYSAGERVFYSAPLPGDKIMVLLADGESVAVDDNLESAGNGLFRKVTTGTPLAKCLEAKDLSATANTSNEHVLVEVLRGVAS